MLSRVIILRSTLPKNVIDFATSNVTYVNRLSSLSSIFLWYYIKFQTVRKYIDKLDFWNMAEQSDK